MLLICLLFSLNVFCQNFGDYKVEKATVYSNNTKFINNEWYKNEDGSFYLKIYSKTPIGIKNAITDTNAILNRNKVSFDSTLADSTYLSSLVKDINDYEMLNISISSESSEVYKNWRISDYQYLTLSLKKDSYEINLLSLGK